MSRNFDLGDILSITTGRLVSPRHIDGVYDILGYLTGATLFTHQLPRAMDECKPWILHQHPQLDSPEMTVMAVGTLSEMLDRTPDDQKPARILGWLSKLKAQYGETLPLKPLPVASDYSSPIGDLVEMVGAEKVLVVDPTETQKDA